MHKSDGMWREERDRCWARCSTPVTQQHVAGDTVLFNLGHFADTFIQRDLQLFIHTSTPWRRNPPCKATGSQRGAGRVRCLAQEHLETQLGGAGDQTRNLLVTSQHFLAFQAVLLEGSFLFTFLSKQGKGKASLKHIWICLLLLPLEMKH